MDAGEKGGESQLAHGFYEVLDKIWEIPGFTEKCSAADLVILGKTYKITDTKATANDNKDSVTYAKDTSDDSTDEQPVIISDVPSISTEEATNNNITEPDTSTALNNIKSFFNKFSNATPATNPPIAKEVPVKTSYSVVELPHEFLDDLYTRLWFTYRSGFPIIERDKNGPSPLSLGSLLRGSLDIQNMGKGFTTDSGWGCMIRTSQSLLANALLSLSLGRDWNLSGSSDNDLDAHWHIVEQFADVPDANYSIQNYVFYAAKYCGRRPGEWFGPSNAAKSIQKLCEEKQTDLKLKVYISTDSGDMFDDELLALSKGEDDVFSPLLILCGVRLGVQTINPVYWDFLKFLLQLKYSVGISGGRPSSSHYFFGYQSDFLFYLDPHVPQNAIILESNGHINDDDKKKILETIHSKKLRKIHISKIDPSMLIGFLIKTKEEYDDFKEKINSFDPNKRFLNVYDTRPPQMPELTSQGSELDGFIDLGVESINEDEDEPEEDVEMEDDNIIEQVKEEAPVTVNNNLIVDAFDLDCDPSENKARITVDPLDDITDKEIRDESLVVVSSTEQLDQTVVINDVAVEGDAGAEEH